MRNGFCKMSFVFWVPSLYASMLCLSHLSLSTEYNQQQSGCVHEFWFNQITRAGLEALAGMYIMHFRSGNVVYVTNVTSCVLTGSTPFPIPATVYRLMPISVSTDIVIPET